MMSKVFKSYLTAFGFMHIIAVALGWYIKEVGPLLSIPSIGVVAGLGTIAAAMYENSHWRGILAVVYCLAWVLEWGRIVTWVPLWDPIQYYLVSFLNLAAAVSLFYLSSD